MSRVACEREMDVTVDRLKEVILDFSSYPKFLSEVAKAEPRFDASKKKVEVDFEVEVIRKFSYTLEFDLSHPNEVAWRLKSGELFKKNEGKWVLRESGNGKTQAHYELEVAVGFFVPSWVSNKLTATSLPKLLENFEGEAVRRQKGSN